MFLLLALIIQLSLDANNKREQRIRESEVAEVTSISNIPDCHQDLYIRDRPCITFIYTPNSSAVVDGIVTRIKANNEPPIADHKVLGFASRFDADQYMLDHPETALGAVHFYHGNLTGADIKFVIQANSTTKGFRGEYQSPITFFTLPFTNAVAREASRAQMLAAGVAADVLQWAPQLLKFPHPQLRGIGMVGYVLGPFIFAACMFGMVTQLAAIVSEKEQGLVTALRHMGLLQSSYWSSWVLFDLLMGLLTALSIVIWGMILQFRFFLHNDAGLLVLLFWLFSIAMSCFSYFLSVFMTKQTSATYTGFAVFLIGWICQTMAIFGLPYDPEYYYAENNAGKAFFWIFACLPWAPLIKGCLDLAAATGSEKDPGLRWSQRDSYCQYIPDISQWPQQDSTITYVNYDCIYPLSQVFATLILQAVGWLLLAVYLDNVYPGGGNNGVARPPWYFLLPSYWLKSTSNAVNQLRKTDSGLSRNIRSGSTIADTSNAGNVPGSPGPAVRVAAELGPASQGQHSEGASTAGSWFGIEEGQLFCLLGPNGAGKTTTINCLTGILPPSGGSMLVCGKSLATQGGLDRVRPQIGVCPQFDVLWTELTGLEHLVVAGHVKGISPSQVRPQAVELLQRVQLLPAAGVRSAAYSGGMKRRLSVALALTGDPKVLYLDEPTTGMDPISRRSVWDVIQAAKPGRAIVLTTHSMEEADILGDRIAIMARGKLKAIGSSIHLKHKFGAGYQIRINKYAVPRERQEQLVVLLSLLDAALGRDGAGCAGISGAVNRCPAEIQSIVSAAVSDIQLSLTSLEEVFLAIAKQAELEVAALTGASVVVQLPDNGKQVQVAVGQDWVLDAAVGQWYRVKWVQDEAGKLAVLEVVPASSGASNHCSGDRAEESSDMCWICLEEASENGSHKLMSPCKCPRKVHPQCLARWQLQQAGRHEEKFCRFCNAELADWKLHLTPEELKPEVSKVQPIMVVYFEGQIHRIPVKQGPDGLDEFTGKIRELFRLPEDVDISLTFGCKEPMSGTHLKLEGMGAFDAAVHCASVAAAERQQKIKKSHSTGNLGSHAAADNAAVGSNGGSGRNVNRSASSNHISASSVASSNATATASSPPLAAGGRASPAAGGQAAEDSSSGGAGAPGRSPSLRLKSRCSLRNITELTDVPELDETVAVGSLTGKFKLHLKAFSRKVVRGLSFSRANGSSSSLASQVVAEDREASFSASSSSSPVSHLQYATGLYPNGNGMNIPGAGSVTGSPLPSPSPSFVRA
eukprot:gene13231-13362_t